MRSYNMYGFAEKYEKYCLDTGADSKAVREVQLNPFLTQTIIFMGNFGQI